MKLLSERKRTLNEALTSFRNQYLLQNSKKTHDDFVKYPDSILLDFQEQAFDQVRSFNRKQDYEEQNPEENETSSKSQFLVNMKVLEKLDQQSPISQESHFNSDCLNSQNLCHIVDNLNSLSKNFNQLLTREVISEIKAEFLFTLSKVLQKFNEKELENNALLTAKAELTQKSNHLQMKYREKCTEVEKLLIDMREIAYDQQVHIDSLKKQKQFLKRENDDLLSWKRHNQSDRSFNFIVHEDMIAEKNSTISQFDGRQDAGLQRNIPECNVSHEISLREHKPSNSNKTSKDYHTTAKKKLRWKDSQ